MIKLKRIILMATAMLLINTSHAVVDYDAGILTIQGVQVFQDAQDANAYYYLPQYPRIATNSAGDFEILLLKYLDAGTDNNGGIFHTLIEFALPDDVRESVAEELADLRPGAELIGALPLLQADEDDPVGGFRVISATLGSSDAGGVDSKVITSGPAALAPGAKAAVAAHLSQQDATILMESLTGATSDISVAIRGYYEAKVKGYNAVVSASMDTVYSHDSIISSYQKGYTKRQLRDVVDELVQDGAINIEVFDRSAALNIDSDDLAKVLDLVTDKITELMFDTETGWSKVPTPEVAVAEDQIKGRLDQGWFRRTFLGEEDVPYYTDDQFVLKRREDIRSNRFYLNLSKSTTIKLPFDSTGNLGGFYNALSEAQRERYFRVIALDRDIDMQTREVFFQVDGEIAEGFSNTFNNVAINVRQTPVEDTPVDSRQLVFDTQSITTGSATQSLNFYRLGDETDEWTNFEYQVAWNLKGRDDPIREPTNANSWIKSKDAIVALLPPLTRQNVMFDVDTADFADKDIVAVVVQVASIIDGTPMFVENLRFRADDPELSKEVTLFSDPDETLAYRTIWYTRQGEARDGFKPINGGFVFVFSPAAEWLDGQLGNS